MQPTAYNAILTVYNALQQPSVPVVISVTTLLPTLVAKHVRVNALLVQVIAHACSVQTHHYTTILL